MGGNGLVADDESNVDGIRRATVEIDVRRDWHALLPLGGGIADDVDHTPRGGDGGGWGTVLDTNEAPRDGRILSALRDLERERQR